MERKKAAHNTDNALFCTLVISQLTHRNHDVLIVTLTNAIYLRLSIHLLPTYLHGDKYILIATDISNLKKKESELNDLIVKLVTHLKKLRELRIGNICETLDVEGGKNKLEIENNKLYKEIAFIDKNRHSSIIFKFFLN